MFVVVVVLVFLMYVNECEFENTLLGLFPNLHSFLERSQSTDEEWSNQPRVSVFDRVYSRVVQIGEAVSLPLYWPSTHWHRPLIFVHHPRSDQSSWLGGHHFCHFDKELERDGFHVWINAGLQGLTHLAAFLPPSVSFLCTTLQEKQTGQFSLIVPLH